MGNARLPTMATSLERATVLGSVVMLLLSMAEGFHISVTTEHSGTNGIGSSSQVILELGQHPLDKEDLDQTSLQPFDVMRHIQQQMRHMFDDVDDDPLDMPSFFSDPFKHLRAMERALLGDSPSHTSSGLDTVLKHIRRHSRDPRTILAAGCHTLLDKCSQASRSWPQAYQCILEHKDTASSKCQAAIIHTREVLGGSSSKDHEPIRQDKDGCWHKPSGIWCLEPGKGWVKKSTKRPAQRKWGESRPGEMYVQWEGPGNPSWEARHPDQRPTGTEVPSELHEHKTHQDKPVEEDSRPSDDLKGEPTPGYLTGKVEAPKGVKDMGGWTARVYTPEQQQRLLVDEFGEPKSHESPKAKSDAADKPKSHETRKAKSDAADKDTKLVKPGKAIKPEIFKQGTDANPKTLLTQFTTWVSNQSIDRDLMYVKLLGLVMVLLGTAYLCCQCCCCSKKSEDSLDTTYEMLLQSGASKNDSSDQL